MGEQSDSAPDWGALAPYAGRWVALVRGGVAGVGWTRAEVLRAARRSRPKERFQLVFVPAAGTEEGDVESA